MPDVKEAVYVEQGGQALRSLRLQSGKTMGDLARFLGVSVPVISDLENGYEVVVQPPKQVDWDHVLDQADAR